MKISTLGLLAACCATAGADTARPAPEKPVPPGQIRPEDTAGLYWEAYETCDDCAKPVALAAYVVPDASTARAIEHALDGKLGFGLPYVIHTDELAVPAKGIAVVIGSFSSRAAAGKAARAAPAVRGKHAVALELGVSDGPYNPAPRHVTVVDRGKPVSAWSRKDVEAVDAAIDEGMNERRFANEKERDAAFWAELAKHKPACTVQPGDLFVVPDADVKWYQLAPVECGGKRAYIPWTSSLLGHAVVVPTSTGHRLYQVTGAMCDSPLIRWWNYDAEGRHDEPERPLLASARC